MASTLHEHLEPGLCARGAEGVEEEARRLEKRSYLPPVSCTDDHELGAVAAKVLCQPRPRVIALPWPEDAEVHQVGLNDIFICTYIRLHHTGRIAFKRPLGLKSIL